MTGRTLSEDCRLHGLMMPMPDDGQCWYCARDAAPVSALSRPDLAAAALHRGLEILLTEGKCSVNDARQVLGLRPFRFVTGRLPVVEGAGAGEKEVPA